MSQIEKSGPVVRARLTDHANWNFLWHKEGMSLNNYSRKRVTNCITLNRSCHLVKVTVFMLQPLLSVVRSFFYLPAWLWCSHVRGCISLSCQCDKTAGHHTSYGTRRGSRCLTRRPDSHWGGAGSVMPAELTCQALQMNNAQESPLINKMPPQITNKATFLSVYMANPMYSSPEGVSRTVIPLVLYASILIG